jgi:hypothetical protein
MFFRRKSIDAKSPVSNGGAKVLTGNSRNWRPNSSPTTPTRRLRVVTPW